ncbi:hypothetical protein DNH61_24220 [Paenibacillus sambharensis]|uniref:Uncharacterized protein n=1 Tax=Paenibacillus sambharensis TaxID=1803190 RepID=A0A2W1LP21_9BACL|nr:hypothetical protein [Paenibacillus sambharensis]PZD93157.1 hypothetical protein DNH61_24220 [Paenibacillus sambharensis]
MLKGAGCSEVKRMQKQKLLGAAQACGSRPRQHGQCKRAEAGRGSTGSASVRSRPGSTGSASMRKQARQHGQRKRAKQAEAARAAQACEAGRGSTEQRKRADIGRSCSEQLEIAKENEKPVIVQAFSSVRSQMG